MYQDPKIFIQTKTKIIQYHFKSKTMIPFTKQGNVKQYDFKSCLAYLHNQGQIKYGKDFKIKLEDYEIFYKLHTHPEFVEPARLCRQMKRHYHMSAHT